MVDALDVSQIRTNSNIGEHRIEETSVATALERRECACKDPDLHQKVDNPITTQIHYLF